MTKIHITGNAGSGKSTLAAELGAALNLPVYGLDQIVWQPGWVKAAGEVIDRREQELIATPSWIIEGVSHTVRDAADTVIFLDVDRSTALLRCARRNVRYLFSGRPGLPENCPEILIIPQLVKIIWRFTSRVRPRLLGDAVGHDSYYIVRSEKDRQQAITAVLSEALVTGRSAS